MEYAVFLVPLILVSLALGFGFGVLTLFLGAAPFMVLVFCESRHLIPYSVGLLGAAGALCFFSKLKLDTDWKEVFRVGPFLFLGTGIAFYFTFPYYFRFPAIFLLISSLVWLFSLPFCPKSDPYRQYTFYPFFSNVSQGLLAGLVIGGLGFAGFALLVPFLQIFRKMDRSAAVSTSIPLGILSLIALVIVLNTPAAAPGPLFADASYNETYYLLVEGLFFLGMLFGPSFGKRLLKSVSPMVVSVLQFGLILGAIISGWKIGKTRLPCLGQNPLSCLRCFTAPSPRPDWSAFSKDDSDGSNWEVVVNSCGQPLGLSWKAGRRNDFLVKLPSLGLIVALNEKTGLYSDAWEGFRTKRVRKHSIYFDRVNCLGHAALSRKKIETQVGVTTIINETDVYYRDVSAARSAFWYLSYLDENGKCNNQSGVIKSSSDVGVFDLSTGYRNGQWGDPSLDEKGFHLFSIKDNFISTLYYSDEECQSSSIATDDDGPSGVDKSVLYHQDKYYLIKGSKPSFEYQSYRPSGKDCIKQHGILSPLSERLAFSVEEIPRPFDFSQHVPFSIRGIGAQDLRSWGIKP